MLLFVLSATARRWAACADETWGTPNPARRSGCSGAQDIEYGHSSLRRHDKRALRLSIGVARLYRCKDDGLVTNLATGSTTSLTSGSTYEAKVVVDEDPNAPDTQRLRFYIDADGDGFGDESAKLTDTTYIDQDWSAGQVGLYGGSRSGYDQEFDDVKVWIDNTGGQTMDDQQIDDNFDSNVLTLTHDDNGNLTDDGVYKYVYDAWNRLVEVKRKVSSTETTVATYAYLPDSRRIKKVVTNCGPEETFNDGGNTTVVFYYDRQWRIVETRNGSDKPTAQYVWGTQYTDELIFVDVNGRPNSNSDCNPDVTVAKESLGENPPDARYFYHQDRNWNVVAISEYDTGDTNNGRIVERYSYTPYGQFVVLAGDSGSGELGNVRPTSTVGNVFTFQGLAHEAESGQHYVRYRMYDGVLGRFVQRDPAGYWGSGMNLYAFVGNAPTIGTDPSGLACEWEGACGGLGSAPSGGDIGATHTECIGPNCPDADDDCPGCPECPPGQHWDPDANGGGGLCVPGNAQIWDPPGRPGLGEDEICRRLGICRTPEEWCEHLCADEENWWRRDACYLGCIRTSRGSSCETACALYQTQPEMYAACMRGCQRVKERPWPDRPQPPAPPPGPPPSCHDTCNKGLVACLVAAGIAGSPGLAGKCAIAAAYCHLYCFMMGYD